MKEDGKLGVSDDNKSIFSTLKSKTLVQIPWGMKEKETRSSKTRPRTIFIFRTQFVRVYKDILIYEDDLCLLTSASTGVVLVLLTLFLQALFLLLFVCWSTATCKLHCQICHWNLCAEGRVLHMQKHSTNLYKYNLYKNYRQKHADVVQEPHHRCHWFVQG